MGYAKIRPIPNSLEQEDGGLMEKATRIITGVCMPRQREKENAIGCRREDARGVVRVRICT